VIFRQLFDQQSSTYTYLLADPASREALLIDPVFEQARRDAALIEELGVKLAWTLDTHVHADHITGAWLLKEKLGSRIAISRASGAEGADRYLERDEKLAFGKRHLVARATPGHTGGCMSYVLDDDSMAFTGDALLIRGCGRTDFQQGDARTLFRSVREQIFSLPDRCLVYPGHDYRGLSATSVGEEKLYNPRLAESIGEQDFVGYMENLGSRTPARWGRRCPPTCFAAVRRKEASIRRRRRAGRRSPTLSPASGKCSQPGSRSIFARYRWSTCASLRSSTARWGTSMRRCSCPWALSTKGSRA
jgi:glyoxylase-like metal-dependent hydrolase (beta-lactamase superfamily II)